MVGFVHESEDQGGSWTSDALCAALGGFLAYGKEISDRQERNAKWYGGPAFDVHAEQIPEQIPGVLYDVQKHILNAAPSKSPAYYTSGHRKSQVKKGAGHNGLPGDVIRPNRLYLMGRAVATCLHLIDHLPLWNSALHTPSIAFRHLPPEEGCRKPVLGV